MDPEAALSVQGPEVVPEPPEEEVRNTAAFWKQLTWDKAAIGLVVLGALLRFADLGRQSMWYDELFSTLVSAKSLPALMRMAIEDTSPPLYYILQHFFLQLFGLSEVTMRFLPALAGVATIWVVYLVGKRLLSPMVAFWSAALFTVGTLPLRYSQEARAYSFMMLFAALSLLTLIQLAERPDLLRASLFGLSLAALVYTHIYGAFGFAAVVLAMLVLPSLRRRLGWSGIAAAGVVALSYVPWALVVLGQLGTVKGWAQGGTWGLYVPSSLADEFARTLAKLTPWPAEQALFPALLFTGLLLVGLLAPVVVQRSDDTPDEGEPEWVLPERDALWLLGIAAIVPIAIGLLLTRYVVPIHDLRNALVALPAIYLLAAAGATRLQKPFGAIMIAVLLAYAVFGLASYYTSTGKGHWREAVTYLINKGANDDLVIASSDYVPLNVNMYSVVLGHPEQFQLATIPAKADDQTLDAELKKALKGRAKAYTVTAFVRKTGREWTVFDDAMERQGWKVSDKQNFEFLPLVREWIPAEQ